MNLIHLMSFIISALIGLRYGVSALERVKSATDLCLNWQQIEVQARNCARLTAALKNNQDSSRFLIHLKPDKRDEICEAEASIKEELRTFRLNLDCDSLEDSRISAGARRILNPNIADDWPNWTERVDFSQFLLKTTES